MHPAIAAVSTPPGFRSAPAISRLPCPTPAPVPTACSVDPDAAPAAAAADASAGGEPLPDGWVEAADPSSGRSYYVHMASGTTQWDRPTAAAGGDAAAATAATETATVVAATDAAASVAPGGARVLSDAMKAEWRKLLDAARSEATTRITTKNKKFSGLRKFAEVAARRKKEAARKKAEEAAADAAAAKAVEDVTKAPRKAIMSFLDVELPKVRRGKASQGVHAS